MNLKIRIKEKEILEVVQTPWYLDEKTGDLTTDPTDKKVTTFTTETIRDATSDERGAYFSICAQLAFCGAKRHFCEGCPLGNQSGLCGKIIRFNQTVCDEILKGKEIVLEVVE